MNASLLKKLINDAQKEKQDIKLIMLNGTYNQEQYILQQDHIGFSSNHIIINNNIIIDLQYVIKAIKGV